MKFLLNTFIAVLALGILGCDSNDNSATKKPEGNSEEVVSAVEEKDNDKLREWEKKRHLADPEGASLSQDWEKVRQLEARHPFVDVFFKNSQEGWAIDSDWRLVHTTDGGENWTTQTSGTELQLREVAFISSTEGWLVGNEGLILHTVDGGNNWTKQL